MAQLLDHPDIKPAVDAFFETEQGAELLKELQELIPEFKPTEDDDRPGWFSLSASDN
jgi:hypothetical protein